MGTSGSSHTTVQQQAPQLLPEGREGYNLGQDYYKSILRNPPVYGGPYGVDPTQAQKAYISQSWGSFGQRQPWQTAAGDQITGTAKGDFLYDPNQGAPSWDTRYIDQGINTIQNATGRFTPAQSGVQDMMGKLPTSSGLENYQPGTDSGVQNAILNRSSGINPNAIGGQSGIGELGNVYAPNANYQGNQWNQPDEAAIQKWTKSASQPYLESLQKEVLPQINSDFGVAGGGVNNAREQIQKNSAIDRTTQNLATDVYAPIFNQMQTLDENFKSAENERRAAIASGDANRIAAASQASMQIRSQQQQAEAQYRAAISGQQAGLQGQEAQFRQGLNTNIANLAGTEAQFRTGVNQARANLGGTEAGFRGAQGATLANLAGTEAGYRGQIAGDYANLLGTEMNNVGQLSGQGASLVSAGNQAANANRLNAWNAERGRQLQAAGMAPDLTKDESLRLQMMKAGGDYEQSLAQQQVDAQYKQFTDPINMQSTAANTLMTAAGMGPGGASTLAEGGSSNTMGQIMQGVQTAALVGKLVAG